MHFQLIKNANSQRIGLSLLGGGEGGAKKIGIAGNGHLFHFNFFFLYAGQGGEGRGNLYYHKYFNS